MRFWDSSAIVPLLVKQPRSPDAERWLSEDSDLMVWTLSPVEVTSALQRLVREGSLEANDVARAEALSVEIARAANVVADVEPVKQLAQRALRLHPLRAADALQLGAALACAQGLTAGLVFHTFHGRLAKAAERDGFDVRG